MSITRNFTKIIRISSLNTSESLELNISDLKLYNNKKLYLIVKCSQKCYLTDGIDIEIFCDFEPGTGLGGSSSLTVAIITALSKLFHFEMSNQKLAEISYDIERNDAGISGGWQDQIAAVNGGLCRKIQVFCKVTACLRSQVLSKEHLKYCTCPSTPSCG